ncbi:hypothetical protein HY625_01950 [Candidatus Uhrbacteria bacterium]|nr:hypothetical protein [Candidatus Uhrbacteria bacterium]
MTHADVQRAAEQSFGDFTKAVVDIERNVMAMGVELHADAEAVLLQDGSERKNLWGINLYPSRTDDAWIQFDSMINIRPSQGNHSRNVEDPATQEKIRQVVKKLVIS